MIYGGASAQYRSADCECCHRPDSAWVVNGGPADGRMAHSQAGRKATIRCHDCRMRCNVVSGRPSCHVVPVPA